METEVDVMKEVLVETESEKEMIEARNKELMSQLDVLIEDQVKVLSVFDFHVYMSLCFVLFAMMDNVQHLNKLLSFIFYN